MTALRTDWPSIKVATIVNMLLATASMLLLSNIMANKGTNAINAPKMAYCRLVEKFVRPYSLLSLALKAAVADFSEGL